MNKTTKNTILAITKETFAFLLSEVCLQGNYATHCFFMGKGILVLESIDTFMGKNKII